MEKRFKGIYDYLSSIDKLGKDEYDRLTNIYGIELINSVIEYMIDEDEKNIYKFAYYVEVLNLYCDSSTSSIDIYMKDIARMSVLSGEENKRYSLEAYEIIKEMRTIFEKFDCKYVNQSGLIFNSILDEVDFYLTDCDDLNIVKELKELYNRFISVRNKLVEGNLRLVVAAMKHYFRDRKTFLECIQYGNIGLMRSVEKYDPSFGIAFSTYSYYWIRQANRILRRHDIKTFTSVSYRAIEKNIFRLKTISELTNELGRVPTNLEVSKRMGISIHELENIESCFIDGISLFSRISVSDSDDSYITVMDMIRDRDVDVENEVCSKDLRPDILNALDECLDERQKYIILNRFGFYGESLTLQQIGDNLGISRQCVEQIQAKALTKIKRLAGKKLAAYLD